MEAAAAIVEEGGASSAAAARRSRRLQPMPEKGEGFGLHLVNVETSKTTGGINVSALEAHYDANLGDFSKFVPWMDYSVQLFSTDGAFSALAVDGSLRSWNSELLPP